MNKWKIAFWLSILLLAPVIIFSLYAILDQAVTLTYHKDSYYQIEEDLNNLSTIINNTDLSRNEIENELKKQFDQGNIFSDQDTIYLNNISLVFDNNKLKNIRK